MVASATQTDPAAVSRPATSATKIASQSNAPAAQIAPAAAANAARRDTAPARTSSCRPASSSPRNAFTAANTAQTATMIEPKPPKRHAV